jgi:predicted permease
LAFEITHSCTPPPRAQRFRQDVLERVLSIPGVQSAAWEKRRPFSYAGYLEGPIVVDGYEPASNQRPSVEYNQISPGYFTTMGIPIVSGREFLRSDDETSFPAVIVNQHMVAKYWHGEDPVGKRVQLNGQSMRIVGVARDSKYSAFLEAPKPFLYVCMRQQSVTNADLVIRTVPSPGTMASRLLREVRSVDSALGMGEVVTMRDSLNRTALASQQIVVALLTIFGAMALPLAAVGIYRVMSYSVSHSKREIGLRMALGANSYRLFRVVMSRGLTLSIAGILLGTVAALALTRFIATGKLLYEVNPLDPSAFLFAASVMIAISSAACLVPAWARIPGQPHSSPARLNQACSIRVPHLSRLSRESLP